MSSVVLLPSGHFRAFAQVRQMREASVFERRDEGALWADAVERRMRAGTWTKRPPNVPPPQQGVTVAKACAKYIESETWLAKKSRTRDGELDKQIPVLAWFGSRLIAELTSDDVKAYIAQRRKVKPQRSKDPDAVLSGDQVRLEMASLSAICNFAVDEKWMATNPTRGVRKPKGSRRTGRLDDDMVGGLLDEFERGDDPSAYPFFHILFTSICRPGELACAQKSWLRHDPPQINIPTTKNEDARSVILTLGSYAQLQVHLARQKSECPFIFGTKKRQGDGWSSYGYHVPWGKALTAVCARLRVDPEGIVPYLARHEGISKLFERTTLSDGQIAGLSGHRSAQALWHYKHLRNEHQRPVINALERLINDAMERTETSASQSERLSPGEMLVPLHDKRTPRVKRE